MVSSSHTKSYKWKLKLNLPLKLETVLSNKSLWKIILNQLKVNVFIEVSVLQSN